MPLGDDALCEGESNSPPALLRRKAGFENGSIASFSYSSADTSAFLASEMAAMIA